MIIDVHAHVGDFRRSWDALYGPLTWPDLIARLDDEGIDKAVFLPVYGTSPESSPVGIVCGEHMSVADQVIQAAAYSERIIPFGNLDPRMDEDLSEMLDWFQDHGCKGVGEVMSRLPYDDSRVINMFRQIGERGMPVTIESNPGAPDDTGYGAGLLDDPGSPRLERLLQAAPEAVIIGHGPGFWAEIAPLRSAEEKCSYALGPISEDGSLARLLRKYPNLYGDLSACSAFTAIARDPEYGVSFLNEFQDKLLFGTDLIARGSEQERMQQKKVINRLVEILVTERRLDEKTYRAMVWHQRLMPQFGYLDALVRDKRISQHAFDKITGTNAARLLGEEQDNDTTS